MNPSIGLDVLYYSEDGSEIAATITAIESGATVSLVYFPPSISSTNFQAKRSVEFNPGVAGCWGYASPVEMVYTQPTPSNVWTISHSMNRYPDITSIDLNGNRIDGDESYPNLDQVVLRFNPAMAGTAILR